MGQSGAGKSTIIELISRLDVYKRQDYTSTAVKRRLYMTIDFFGSLLAAFHIQIEML